MHDLEIHKVSSFSIHELLEVKYADTTRYFGSITIFVSVATRMLVKGSCFSRASGSVNDDWSFERSVAGVFLTWAYVEKETRSSVIFVISLQGWIYWTHTSLERFPNSYVCGWGHAIVLEVCPETDGAFVRELFDPWAPNTFTLERRNVLEFNL